MFECVIVFVLVFLCVCVFVFVFVCVCYLLSCRHITGRCTGKRMFFKFQGRVKSFRSSARASRYVERDVAGVQEITRFGAFEEESGCLYIIYIGVSAYVLAGPSVLRVLVCVCVCVCVGVCLCLCVCSQCQLYRKSDLF